MPEISITNIDHFDINKRDMSMSEHVDQIIKSYLNENMLHPTFKLDFKSDIDMLNNKYKEKLYLHGCIERRFIFFIDLNKRTIEIVIGIPLKNKNFYFEANGDFEIRTFEDDVYLVEKYKYGRLDIYEFKS